MSNSTTSPTISAVHTAAQELIEHLESTGRDYFNYHEAGKVWKDEEGDFSTPPAMVIVLRGIKTDTEAIQVLQSRLLID